MCPAASHQEGLESMKRGPTDSLLPFDSADSSFDDDDDESKPWKEPCIIIQEVKKEEPSLPVQGGLVAQLNNVSNMISKIDQEEEGSWRETEERKMKRDKMCNVNQEEKKK